MASLDEVTPKLTVPGLGGKALKDEIAVSVNGAAFFGWKEVTVRRSLRELCNSFTIVLDDRFDGGSGKWPLVPDTEIKIGIGADPVFTGRIEAVEPSYDAESRSMTISGRSLAGDIVDCEHEGPMEFSNITVDRLAEKLVKPFGLKVYLSVIPDKISKFAVKPGETVFEAIDRAARLQGCMWVSTRGGNIRLVRVSKDRSVSTLEQDINIQSASARYDGSKRFSKYTVKGQADGLEDFFGKSVAQPIGTAVDNGVKRYRPKTIIAEGSVDNAQAKKRAQWEASTRLADTVRVSVETDSWRQQNGALWDLNQLVRVKSKYLGIDRELLVDEVTLYKSTTSGSKTNLDLTDPQAYNTEPEVNKKKKESILESLGLSDIGQEAGGFIGEY